MDTQSAIFLFLKEKVCNGYSLEAALSSVNAVHLYLIGLQITVAEVVNSVAYEFASYMSRYI